MPVGSLITGVSSRSISLPNLKSANRRRSIPVPSFSGGPSTDRDANVANVPLAVSMAAMIPRLAGGLGLALAVDSHVLRLTRRRHWQYRLCQ